MQRASDAKYLGPGGWQESETPLAPDAWDNDGGSLRLAVGPAVVDEVDNLSAYRITLSGRGSCTLAVKNIVYSHITGGQGMGGTSAEPTPPPQPEPVPEPAPEPEAAPQEPAEPPLVLGPVEDPLAGASIDMPLDEKKPKGKGLVVLLLVLAALAAAAVWWFVLRAPEKAPLPVPPAAAEQTPGNEKQPPAAAPQPGSQGAQSQPTPLAAAREQLRGQALPDVSLGMGYVLQTGGLLPFLTAGENITLRCKTLGNLAQRQDAVNTVVARLGIGHLLGHYPATLSVGERQRVAIAAALAHGPSVVLADEPTAALDPGHAANVLRLLGELALQLRITVIMVTHNLEQAQQAGFSPATVRLQTDATGSLSCLAWPESEAKA